MRVSRLSSEALGIVAEAVRQLARTCILQKSPSLVRLDLERLAGVPEPMVRAMVMELWCSQEWPRQGMSFAHWKALSNLVREGTAVDLPGGVRARRNGSVLRIERDP